MVTIGDALGAVTPIDDLGLVDVEAEVIGSRQARGVADGTVDIDHASALAADQVVVVVSDPGLETGGRPRGLDPANESGADQGAETVVDGLERDRAQFRPHGLGHIVGGHVGPSGDHAQHGNPLRRHMDTAVAQLLSMADGHEENLPENLDSLKIWSRSDIHRSLDWTMHSRTAAATLAGSVAGSSMR